MTEKKSIKAIAKTENLNKIMQLKLRGYTDTNIANSLNTTTYKVAKLYKEALTTVNNDSFEKLKTVRDTTQLRYESLLVDLYAKLKNLLPSDVKLDKESAINRINKMNLRYEEIKDKGFDYVDEFYGLHGSHRNRND